MKITAKLRPRPNADGTHAIQIVVTMGNKRTYHTLPFKVKAKDWDGSKVKPSHPNASAINTMIRTRITDLEMRVMQKGVEDKPVTLHNVKQMMHGKAVASIMPYVAELVKNLKGKFSDQTLESYTFEASRLESFRPGMTFDDVTPQTLRQFEAFLRSQNLSTNTIHKVWKRLRKFFNSAVRDGVTSNYPFSHYDNPKYRQTDRTYLTEAEVNQVEAVLKLPIAEYHYRAAVFFLLGCYSGLRVSDWIRFNESMVQGDRLILRAKKNGELVSMKIHTKLKKIIAEIITGNLRMDSEQKTNEYLKAVGRIAGLSKTLTTHVGRHSFAVRCAELGISIETTSALMGITPKSCAYYYKVTNRKIDQEVDKWG